MRRKLVKQGENALTVTLPAQWTKKNNLIAGNEVDINEENNLLLITSALNQQLQRSITINIVHQNSNIYRSLIGAYYRAGYDEIKLTYTSIKVIPELQKAVDLLYGFEMFEQKENSCIIRKMYESEPKEVFSIINKIVQTIKTMQGIIMNDIKINIFSSQQEILQFRNNLIKYRDVISRIIAYHKLIDEKHFAYKTIAYNLWQIARCYNHIYGLLSKNCVSKQEILLSNEVNQFFTTMFQSLKESKHIDFHTKYETLLRKTEKMLKNKNVNHLFLSYYITILMQLQSCNSPLVLLQEKK